MGKPKTRHNRTSKKGKVFPAGRGVKKDRKCKICHYIINPVKGDICSLCRDKMKGKQEEKPKVCSQCGQETHEDSFGVCPEKTAPYWHEELDDGEY